MATHKSAAKRTRQALVHRERNRTVISALKTITKKVLTAIENSNLEDAKRSLRLAASTFAKAAEKGIIHKNNAARNISRLTLKVNNLVKSLGAPSTEEGAKKAVKAKTPKKAAAKKPKAKAASKKKS
ncbi:MAG: 30S ribosomal protein S20 [Nitrospirae bacterium]|nr:30S ribosomal protein S20 [Nitrospirota bacterium]